MEQHQQCNEHSYLLGEIKAKTDIILDSINRTEGKLDTFEGRLKTLEVRSGLIGGISGAVLAVGISLLSEKLKLMLHG